MRRILLTYILLVVGLLTAQAQFNPTQQVDPRTGRDANGNQIDPAMRVQEDSTDVEIQGLPPTLYMWHVSESLGTIQRIPADTATHMFQNTNLVEGLTGHYNYLGNLGSPRLSRLFFERRDAEPTIFMEPFSSFFIRPDEFNFTNSNVPFTNLTYYKAGNKINGEDIEKAKEVLDDSKKPEKKTIKRKASGLNIISKKKINADLKEAFKSLKEAGEEIEVDQETYSAYMKHIESLNRIIEQAAKR